MHDCVDKGHLCFVTVDKEHLCYMTVDISSNLSTALF